MMKRLSVIVCLAISMGACASEVTSPSAPAPRTVSGIVTGLTPTGRGPIEGIPVTATFGGGALSATTDAKGFYSIEGPAAATNVHLAVRSADYEAFDIEAWSTGATRVDIRLLRAGTYTISGVLSEQTSTGMTPVGGVVVDTWSCKDGSPNCREYSYATATTDSNGFYSIPGMWAGDVGVWAYRTGYAVDVTPPSTPCDGCSLLVPLFSDMRLDIPLVRH